MESVQFEYYVKYLEDTKEKEWQVIKNKNNRHIITALKEHPELHDKVWCTQYGISCTLSESNRCNLTINTNGYGDLKMKRDHWKKVIALRLEKTEIKITTTSIFSY